MCQSCVEAVKGALCQRIRVSHLEDMVLKYGIDKVMDEVEHYSESYGGRHCLEEIGSSDVSCWIKDMQATLERQKQRREQSVVLGDDGIHNANYGVASNRLES